MNKFIVRLFNQFNYNVLDELDSISFIKHRDYSDFWIIVNGVGEFKLEGQEAIAEKAKTIFAQYKEAEKNTSLLVLLQVEQISQDILDAIIELENNPFYFKKYILAYTEDSSNNAIEKCKDEAFPSLLMKPSNFQGLKDEKYISGPYHLLYTIAHKLPFIMTNVQLQGTTDLYSNKYIPREELQETFDWLQSIDLNMNDITEEVRKKFETSIN